MSLDALFQNLSLPDLWQQEGLKALRSGQDVIVDAPTGAGKTRIFELFVESKGIKQGRQAIYTVPTRALANDKWAEWRERSWDVGIATGDLAENTKAPVVVATLETQRERFLQGKGPDLLVVDEYQLISDPVRGLHYELALALAPSPTQLLLLSGSVRNPEQIRDWLVREGRNVSLIQTSDRPVPLDDIHLLGLPHQAPRHIKHFWARLAAEVLLADMAPLLIFVPHRKGAEKVARQIAEALPAVDPLELTLNQEQLAGKTLKSLLVKRIAYHHSGQRYELRAGLIEPLARQGQLRIIVATMGLAAGINFSVRSTFVAESSYQNGPYLHQLQPDELLQMFGRAGRRGKDTHGFVIHGDKNPRLLDARRGEVHRANEIDWPTLIRVMHHAAERNEPPFPAAEALCQSLFSKQPILLGIESGRQEPAIGEQAAPNRFGLGPSRREILNSANSWEAYDRTRHSDTVPLGDCLIRENESWRPARKTFSCIAHQTPLGRIKSFGDWLGKEVIIANRREDGSWKLTKSLTKKLPRRFSRSLTSIEDQLSEIEKHLTKYLSGGKITQFDLLENQFVAHVDFRSKPVAAYRDASGQWLIDPPDRMESLQPETGVLTATASIPIEPPKESPVHAWRSLGLIAADGIPTRRGLIFSHFYHGEGLAIAAALESPHYEVSDLVSHLPNLRAGHRFSNFEGHDSERLGIVCRQTYGPVTHEGYLRLGLPTQYGEGAAESLASMLEHHGKIRLGEQEELGRGDLERALHEWMSLLRQIIHADIKLDWNRWRSFQQAARDRLTELESQVRPITALTSTLTAKQKTPFQRHRLHYKDLR